MITQDEINEAYQRSKHALRSYCDISQELYLKEYELQTSYLNGILSGSINGKNSEMREAQSREQFSMLHTSVGRTKIQSSRAKFDLDLARLEIDRLKMLMRLMEIKEDAE